MAEAVIRLGLDPSGLIAGSRSAVASLRSVGRAARSVAKGYGAVGGAAGAQQQMYADRGLQQGRDVAASIRSGIRRSERGIRDAIERPVQAGVRSAVKGAAGTVQATAADARPGTVRGAGFTMRDAGVAADQTRTAQTARATATAVAREARRGVTQGPGFTMREPARPAPAAEMPLPAVRAERVATATREPIRGAGFTMREPAAPARQPAAATAAADRAAPRRAGGFAAGAPGAFGTDRGPATAAQMAADAEARKTRTAWRRNYAAANRLAASTGKAADDVGSFGRMWSAQIVSSSVRRFGRALSDASQATVEVAATRQTAAAEIRTVEPTAEGRELIFTAARQHAAGRTEASRIAGVTEAEFMEAAFAARASGFTAQQAAAMVPQAALLGIAGQIDPKQAQIAISDAMSIFRDRSVADVSDMFARAQDIGVFPTGAGQMFDAFTKMAGTAQAAGMGMEEALAVAVGLSGLGSTFRGATGGQKGLMAIREMEMGAMEKLGLATRRTATGGLDFTANIAALKEAGPSVTAINEAFGKRAAPAILGLMERFDTLEAGLGDFGGTAIANAREHMDTYDNSLKKMQARMEVFRADMGEGAIAVRKFGHGVTTWGTERVLALAEAMPGLAPTIGGALEVGSVVAQGAGGALETAVGVAAFAQLMGVEKPLGRMMKATGRGFGRLFGVMRGGTAAAKAATASMDALTPRIGATGRSFERMFGQVDRGFGLTKKGFGSMFGKIGAGIGAVSLLAGGLLALGDLYSRAHGEKTFSEHVGDIVTHGFGNWLSGLHQGIREDLPDKTPEGWKPRFPGDVPPATTGAGAGQQTTPTAGTATVATVPAQTRDAGASPAGGVTTPGTPARTATGALTAPRAGEPGTQAMPPRQVPLVTRPVTAADVATYREYGGEGRMQAAADFEARKVEEQRRQNRRGFEVRSAEPLEPMTLGEAYQQYATLRTAGQEEGRRTRGFDVQTAPPIGEGMTVADAYQQYAAQRMQAAADFEARKIDEQVRRNRRGFDVRSSEPQEPGGLRGLFQKGLDVAGGLFDRGRRSGQEVVAGMAQGMLEVDPLVLQGAAAQAFGALNPYFPGSDAERGPLSRLSAAGAAIPKTMAEGMRAAGDVIGDTFNTLSAPPPDVGPGGSGRGGTGDQALAAAIDNLTREIRRQTRAAKEERMRPKFGTARQMDLVSTTGELDALLS